MAWQWWEAVAASQLAEERRVEAEAASQLAEKRRNEAQLAQLAAEEDSKTAQSVADYLGGLFEEADPFVISGRLLDPTATPNPTAADVVAADYPDLANSLDNGWLSGDRQDEIDPQDGLEVHPKCTIRTGSPSYDG